jgi:hypothetical protein
MEAEKEGVFIYTQDQASLLFLNAAAASREKARKEHCIPPPHPPISPHSPDKKKSLMAHSITN